MRDSISEEYLNDMKISNLPDKVFKVMVVKMFTDLMRRMDEDSENFKIQKTEESPIPKSQS